MKRLYFRDCAFHDASIRLVEYNGELLTLHINDFIYENSRCNFKLELKIDKSGVIISYIKRYPRFHKVKIRGKEISDKYLESLFKKGCTLEWQEFFVSVDANIAILKFELLPYSKRSGYNNEIVIELHYDNGEDYFTLKEENEP